MSRTLSICTIAQDEEEPIRWYLEACKFLAKQIGDNLCEVVIVDGGSKDATVDVIESYKQDVPIKLLHRPYDNTRDQQNFGLDNCTGDYVFTPDADMTWSSNLGDFFMSGFFDRAPFWDFFMFFTARDAYHFFHKWPIGVNMRLHRRGPKWTRKFHVVLEGQQPAVCNSVVVFENSCRISSEEALMNRGRRRQIHADEMHLEGGHPGPEDRFLGASRAPDTDISPLPPKFMKLVIPGT